MRKQVFGKAVGILLAVLFVVSLTASAGLASCSTCDSSCPSCSACDSSCPSCSACDNSCPSCSACGSSCGCEKKPTWEDWFNAFKNDGFETWAGFNFANFWGNF